MHMGFFLGGIRFVYGFYRGFEKKKNFLLEECTPFAK